MARPVAADAEATRARILHAALKLVSERGIEGTSIRDVAAGAKVSLATVLHYYGSKEGLYDACIRAMYIELEALREVLFASVSSTDLDGLIRDVVHAAVDFVRTHRAAHQILLRDVLDEGGMRAEYREKYLKPFLDDVSALLSPLTGVPEASVKLTAQSVVHLTVRYMLHNPAELRLLTGEIDEKKAHAAVERHIADIARAMLLRRTP